MTGRPRLPDGEGERIALAALNEAGTTGLDTRQVAALLGTSTNRANMLMLTLVKAGKVQRLWKGGRTPAQWWANGHAPRLETISAVHRVCTQPPRRLSLDPAAPAICPPHVQVQKIQHGEDKRFSVETPKGWRGQITSDWLARRQEGGHGAR